MSNLNIPESWAETFVGEVIKLENGFAFKSDEFSTSGIPVVRISNIQDGFVDLNEAKYIKEKAEHERFVVRKNDLLVAMSGATTGKMGVYNLDQKSLLNQRVGNLRVLIEDTIDLRFRNYFFKKSSKEILDKAYGGAQPNISGKMIEELLFPLPPFDEQKRIAGKIELCLKKIDDTEANLAMIENILEKLSISFLTKNGDWLESVTLEELTEERSEKIREQNPLCRKIGVDNQIGVVDLRLSGKLNFEKYKIVKNGDILYNPMRVNVGSIALYMGDDDAITSPDYIVFRVKTPFSKWLVFKFLKSHFGAEEISKKLKGAVRERLYYKSLKDINFPNPSNDVHQKADRIIELISSELISQKDVLLQLIAKLKVSLLQKAFEGRLVEQISSEGTGHELLGEILAHKQSKATTELKLNKFEKMKAIDEGNKNGKK